MQESIERLNAQPRAEKPAFDTPLNTWFLLDKVRGEKTLPAFYQGGNSGLIASIDYLLLGTEHAQLIEASPLLIKLNHTQLSDSLYKYIQQERSGIFIQAKDDNILTHLQYLFSMQSESDGAVYARYYDPIFWTALQLSLADQQQNIWGNLQKVHTLAPESSEQQSSYINWSTPEVNNQNIYIKPEHLIKLDNAFEVVGEMLRLLTHVIYPASAQQIQKLTKEQLHNALTNLREFNKAGIEQVDYLQRLLPWSINQPSIIQKTEIAQLLNADLLDYEKIDQIEQIMKEQSNG